MPAVKASTKNTSKRSKRVKGRSSALEKARQAKSALRAGNSSLDTCSAAVAQAPSTVSLPLPSSSESQPTALGTERPFSASKRKLEYFPVRSSSDTVSSLCSTVVQLTVLQKLFADILCPSCLQPSLRLCGNDKKNCGLSVFLEVMCDNCDTCVSSSYTSGRINNLFDVNRRAVATSLANGSGRAGLSKFCELMDIPVMHHKTYNRHLKDIHALSRGYSNKMLSEAVEVVRKAYPEQTGKEIVDVDVSYDGSWHTRGHKSMSGIGCVIENRTGLVVDYECLSKYCHSCATVGSKIDDKDMYLEWEESHRPVCDKNHSGSSGSMEQKAAVIMWGRSIQKNKLRYRTVVSDGDANTIKQLHDAEPYSDLVIEKRECVNHVAKRLGTALRKLVENKKKVKITLGGNGKGKLTQVKIARLQKYYTRALRSNNTVEGMKSSIWASLEHCSSSNENPHHELCPEGSESWCFFQKAIAKGLPPPDHEKHMTTYICPFVYEHIKDVYVRLTDNDLLNRCVEGMTQNVNESIHSLIWSRCPKHVFVGRQRLEVSVGVGVGEFNKGAGASEDFIAALGLSVGSQTRKFGLKRDCERKRKAEKACENATKRRREVRRLAQTREEERLVELEGGEQYSAGAF